MTTTDAKLVALAEEVIGLTDLAEFRVGLLHALRRAVPSKFASLNDFGPSPSDTTVIAVPYFREDTLEAFARYRHQNPIAAYYTRTRDGRAYRLSDLITRQQLRALELYREVYAPLGVEYQIAFTLPSNRARLLAVALSRSDRDYTNTERDLLNRARPLLIQAFRTTVEHDRLTRAVAALRDGRAIEERLRGAGLTSREAEIVNLLAHGHSKRDIAERLSISPRTVAKHLEHCFAKLGVSSQSAAAAKAWALAELTSESSSGQSHGR